MRSRLNGSDVSLRPILIGLVLATGLSGRSAVLASLHPSEVCQGTERSRTLVAENGHRAYVETYKRTIVDAYNVTCGDSADLYLALKSKERFAKVLAEPANSNWSSIGIRLIDWSRDGRYLLAELRQADSGGERADDGPLVYDSLLDHTIRLDVLKLFQSHFHRNCTNDTVIEGFTPDGIIVLTAKAVNLDPTFEPEMPPVCIAGTTKWAIDLRKHKIHRLPDDYKTIRYSHVD